MSATEKGLYMDAPEIRREFGFNEALTNKIIRWCAQKKGHVLKVVPPEGRKTLVRREDVLEWIAEHIESAA